MHTVSLWSFLGMRAKMANSSHCSVVCIEGVSGMGTQEGLVLGGVLVWVHKSSSGWFLGSS